MVMKELLILAVPIVIGQLSQMLIGVGDVFVAGQHGVNTVAAIGVAQGMIGPLFMIGSGFIMGMSPILARRRAEGEDTSSLYLISCCYGLVIALFYWCVLKFLSLFIDQMGIAPEIIPGIREFIDLIGISGFGAYLYIVSKEFLQSYEKTIFANVLAAIGVLLNLLFCFVLVFGWWGFPSMGPRGVATSSIIVRSLMGLALFIYAFYFFVKNKKSANCSVVKFDWRYIKEVSYLGFPIGCAIFFEVSAFGLTTVLVGGMDVLQAASNNIVMSFASISFMVPLAIASAVSVKVGRTLGEKDYDKMNAFIRAALQLSLGFMGMMALVFLLVPSPLVRLFSSDGDVLKIAIPLLAIVGFFQLFDGLQVTLSGVLRGLGKAKPTFYTTLFGYWVIGIPLGCLLAYHYELESKGLWIGLATALASVGLILFRYLKKHLATFVD